MASDCGGDGATLTLANNELGRPPWRGHSQNEPPYLPAREPWRGRDVLQRAWRVTLAGPASDPGGAGDRHSGTRKRSLAGHNFGTRKTSLAGHPGGDGGRPWRGPRTTRRRRPTTHSRRQAGTVEPIGERRDPSGAGERPWRGRRATLAGTGVLVLAKGAWRATLAGTADDPGGAQLWHSQNELGRPADNAIQEQAGTGTRKNSLAADPGGHGGQPWRDPGGDGGNPGGDNGRPAGTARKTSLLGGGPFVVLLFEE